MPDTYYYATGEEVTSVANAIRRKTGGSASLVFPDEFVTAIDSISGSGSTGQTHTATLTGTSRSDLYVKYNDTNYLAGTTFSYHAGDTCILSADGIEIGVVIVDGQQIATGFPARHTYTLPEHDINVSFTYGTTGKCEVSFPEVSITTNGKHNVDGYVYANVAVPSGSLNLQAKTGIIPTTSSQTITPDSGYGGLSSVQINAMPTMTLPTSASSSATSGYTSKATIGRSTSNQYINIPTGYNSAGGYYTISAVANGSASGPSSVNGTSATVSTGTNTLTLTKTVSITPTVSAGYIGSGTATNATVSLTASVTTKAAATITPGTSNQTIASGTYLTGTQTISGDANLVAGNIKSGVSIFGVAGSYSASGKNAQAVSGVGRVNTTAYTAVSGQTLTVSKTGTYHVYWFGYRSSTSGTSGSQLYIGDNAYGSAQTTFNSTYTNCQTVHLTSVSLTADQVITVRARARNTSSYMYIGNLTIIEA